jgi:hypothetical protein
MKLIFTFILTIFAVNAFALNCDCEVRIYSPTTGSYKMTPNSFKTYELEEFSSYHVKNQLACRELCLEKFEQDMPSDRVNALLMSYAQSLISEGAVGYNCTGLTTMKFPVRVKASLGRLGLGNVSDTVRVVTHEQLCF